MRICWNFNYPDLPFHQSIKSTVCSSVGTKNTEHWRSKVGKNCSSLPGSSSLGASSGFAEPHSPTPSAHCHSPGPLFLQVDWVVFLPCMHDHANFCRSLIIWILVFLVSHYLHKQSNVVYHFSCSCDQVYIWDKIGSPWLIGDEEAGRSNPCWPLTSNDVNP